MSEKENNAFKRKEGKIIITLFLVVVAVLTIMNAYERFSPSIIGNNKPVTDGGVCGLICFRDRRIDKMKADIVKSDDCIFTDDDIDNAVKAVKEYFKQQKNEIGLCSLKFDEEKSADFLKSCKAAEDYSKNNVIVIMCDYNVYEELSLKQGFYENHIMILAREKSEWHLIDGELF